MQGLAQLGHPVDLFIHDSLHTGRNVRFELDCVWPALSAGGVALVDDVEQNAAFAAFARRHRDATALVREAEDGRAQFGPAARKPRLSRGLWAAIPRVGYVKASEVWKASPNGLRWALREPIGNREAE